MHFSSSILCLTFSDAAANEMRQRLIKKMGVITQRFKIESGLNVEHTEMDVIKRQIDKYDAVAICDINKEKQSNNHY